MNTKAVTFSINLKVPLDFRSSRRLGRKSPQRVFVNSRADLTLSSCQNTGGFLPNSPIVSTILNNQKVPLINAVAINIKVTFKITLCCVHAGQFYCIKEPSQREQSGAMYSTIVEVRRENNT